MSIVVDLPAPLGPSRATVSPGAIAMSTPRTAWTGPAGSRNVLCRPGQRDSGHGWTSYGHADYFARPVQPLAAPGPLNAR